MKERKISRKTQSQPKQYRTLIILASLLVIILGVALVNRPKALGCQFSVDHQYPPAVGFYPTQWEMDQWINGYRGDDPQEHLLWAIDLLANSAFPIGPETMHFLDDNRDKVMFNIQSIDSGAFALVRPINGKITININIDTIAGPQKWHSYYLLMAIVHETVHVEQLLMKAQLIAQEEQISIEAAYEVVYKRLQTNNEEWLCAEMEAFSQETALYAQIKSARFMSDSPYYDEMLQTLISVNWNWKANSWLYFIQRTSPEYDRK